MRTKSMLRSGLAGVSLATVMFLSINAMAQTTPAPQPNICTRSCWSARNGTCTATMSSLSRAIIHHTASSGDWSTTSLSDSAARMRSHQNYHMDVNGWCDIGYHFLVDKLGNIFEGRKNSMTSLIKGTHAGCGNNNTFGFTFLGYCHSPYNHNPPVAMRNAIYDVIAWRMPSGWNPYGGRTSFSGSMNGTAAPIDTHRWVGASGSGGCVYTSCPGDVVVNNYITDNFFGGEMRTGVATRRSPAPPPPPIPGYKPAIFRGAGEWYLRNSNTTGGADSSFFFGGTGDIPVMGDWDGNGSVTPGVFRNGQWFLRNSNSSGPTDISFWFGGTGDIPVVGDWNGDGVETIGVFRAGRWFLSDNFAGTTHYDFWYGASGDKPISGDWNGDGIDSIGVFRNFTWYMRNSNSGGGNDYQFDYGNTGDLPIVGDWDNNGTFTVGIIRGYTRHLRNSNSAGVADITFDFGLSSDKHLTWK